MEIKKGKNKKMTLDKLAGMVARGFANNDKRFDRIESILTVEHAKRIDKVESDVKKIKETFVLK